MRSASVTLLRASWSTSSRCQSRTACRRTSQACCFLATTYEYRYRRGLTFSYQGRGQVANALPAPSVRHKGAADLGNGSRSDLNLDRNSSKFGCRYRLYQALSEASSVEAPRCFREVPLWGLRNPLRKQLCDATNPGRGKERKTASRSANQEPSAWHHSRDAPPKLFLLAGCLSANRTTASLLIASFSTFSAVAPRVASSSRTAVPWCTYSGTTQRTAPENI